MSTQLSSRDSWSAACPLCNNSVSSPILSKNDYTIARCAACDTLYVSPMPPEELLQAHYQDPAYFCGQEEQGYHNYSDMHKALRPHMRRRIQSIDRYLAKGQLLDFGCAAGYFLQVALASGWQIAGVELAHEMAQVASQTLQIPIASSLDSLGQAEFDAITAWEVIEHLPRPVETLHCLHDHLRPGGLLMLSTPNTGHWQAVREPENWISYRPPSHLLFFTAKTLTDALERAGYERISIQRVSPLPPLPGWLRRASAPLQRGLVSGQARAWTPALWAWRAIRLGGWGWQRLRHSGDDIFTTLEATAFRA
jgi:2-polyprenyl-3-methyl-5-hydroxy-6-metoxy-1,4-benzoquinol methylase